MDQTGEYRSDYWKDYYETHFTPTYPSQFAKFVTSQYRLANEDVLDLCCGNGRDSYYLGEHANRVVGVDVGCCPEPRDNVMFVQTDIDTFSHIYNDSFTTVYCRFGIHAVTEEVQDTIFRFGEFLCLECRSDKDRSFIPDHYRRLINFADLQQQLPRYGYNILFAQESRGLAKHGYQDPVIIRVIAEKL